MTRLTRSDDAAHVAPAHSSSGPWAMWPWPLQDAQVEITRGFMDMFNKSATCLRPAATLEAWNAAQAKFVALWIDQLRAVQVSWLELAKLVPGAQLMPFGLMLPVSPVAGERAAAAATGACGALASMLKLGQFSPETLFAQWADAWKPAHTEDVVA
jgi:hypothetical protein